MNKKFLAMTLASVLCLSVLAQADNTPQASITRTSPNHTTIVIHDYTPRAQKVRAEQAQRAQRQLELKRQRAHEIKLAEIRAGANNSPAQYSPPAPVARQADILPSIAERQRAQAYRPAPFFNGGIPTTNIAFAGGFFNGFGVGNFGFPINYGVGNVCAPVVPRGGYRGGFRGGYRGGYRGGGFRGGGFRGGGVRGGGVRGGGCR